MPRVITKQTSRKEHSCRKCGRTIPKGEGYCHWSFRYGGTVVRCLTCPRPRQSELTQSDKLSRIYQCEEMIEDAISEKYKTDEEAVDGIKSAVESAVELSGEVADEYEEALDAWENGNSMLEEKKEAAESYHDELEQASSDMDSMSVEDYEEDAAEDEDNTAWSLMREAVESLAMDAAGSFQG